MDLHPNARTFVTTVIALGGIFTMNAAFEWTGNLLVVAAYVILAAQASTLKVRLPGVQGTFSANCLVTILAISQLTTAEFVVVSVACALVQSWWRAAKPPEAAQVAFNVGVFATSATVSAWTHVALLRGLPGMPEVAALIVASCVFFVLNTGAVSLVLAMNEGVSAHLMWRAWHFWSLVFYLLNIGSAVLIISLVPSSILLVVVLVMPFMVVPFAAYQWLVRRTVPRVAQTAG